MLSLLRKARDCSLKKPQNWTVGPSSNSQRSTVLRRYQTKEVQTVELGGRGVIDINYQCKEKFKRQEKKMSSTVRTGEVSGTE